MHERRQNITVTLLGFNHTHRVRIFRMTRRIMMFHCLILQVTACVLGFVEMDVFCVVVFAAWFNRVKKVKLRLNFEAYLSVPLLPPPLQ